MRISDWSSDVCSSDLFARLAPLHYATFLFYLLAGFLALQAGYDGFEMIKYRPDCAWTHVVFLQAHGLCDGRSFNDVSWSIGAEMTVYLLFPLFLTLLGVHRALPALVEIGRASCRERVCQYV